MGIEKARCPWCGHEIEKPKIYRGVCEACGKPYRCMAFSYNWDRLRQKCVGRREVPALWHFVSGLLMNGMMLFVCLKSFYLCWQRRNMLVGLWTFVMFAFMLYVLRNLLFHKQQVHLIKDVKGEEGSGDGNDVGGEKMGRRLFFIKEHKNYYYHSPFLIEVLNPETSIYYDKCQVLLNVEEDLTVFVEIREDTPEYLDRPGMAFNVYDENGNLENSGITMDATGEYPELYQIALGAEDQEIKLDKGLYYVACMKMEDKEESFCLIPEAGDMLEGLKTGRTIYEVRLFHHSLKPRELPIPTDFRLYTHDGTYISDGSLTHFFEQRFIISRNSAGGAF